jgi:hypothetical protein
MRHSWLLLPILVLMVVACAGGDTAETTSIAGTSTTSSTATPSDETAVSAETGLADVELGEPIPLGTGDPVGLVAGSGRVWVLTASLIEPEDEFESELAFTVRLFGLDEATQEKGDEFHLGELSNLEIWGLGYAADRIWVSANRQVSCDPVALECVWHGRVVTIDPDTGEITQMIEVEGRPHQIAVGLGSVWVGGDQPRGSGPSMEGNVRVDRIDPQTGAIVASIPVHGDYLAGPTVSENGVWVTVSEEEYTLSQYGGLPYDLVWIDPNTNQPEREWRLNDIYPEDQLIRQQPWEMVGAYGDAWLDMMASLPNEDFPPSEVVRIDPDGDTVARFHLEGSCRDMTGCQGLLWVIDAPCFPDGSTHLKGIDPETNQVTVDLDLAEVTDSRVIGLACGDQTLWVLGGSRPNETSSVELVLIPLVP